jgi:tRNA pseudouridine38-40 synthase
MNEKNVKIVVEYKGTAFSGWQYQPGRTTIQGELVRAIHRVTGREVSVIGAGRTDAGVHALGQVANFRIDHPLKPTRYRDALNYYLSDDIRVKQSTEVTFDFHSTRDAGFRRYRYLLSAELSALYRDLRWEHPVSLDMERLKKAADLVLGEHDFGPFCVTASRKENNVCRIDRSRWFRVGPLFVYEIRGNRFLHAMVRSLVGAMVNVATLSPDRNMRNLTLKQLDNIINVEEDARVTFTAPAHGLYLVSVGY